MNRLLTATALSVALMLVIAPMTHGQDKAAPAAAAEKVFQGQLTKVDANAKSISVKGPRDAEMTFEYTDATQVTGPDKTVQGLAGKTGTEIKVSYVDSAGKHTATKIEAIEKPAR